MQTSSSRLALAMLLFGLCSAGIAADFETKAGGVSLILPGPGNDFVETGDKLRTTFFEFMVPASNRLLSAYLRTETLAEITKGKPPGDFEVYALVEVSRKAEYNDLSPEDFQQVLKGFDDASSKFDAAKVEEEMNIHLKALGTKPVGIGKPEMLGALFQKPNAMGFAILTAIKQTDRTSTIACGIGVLRIKQRLVFAYLYRKYESPETVTWLRKNLADWTDTILAKNH